MNVKKAISLIALSAVLILLSGCRKEPAVPLAFFFLETCPGCESYLKSEELNGLVISLTRSGKYAGRGWNMAFTSEEAGEELMKMIEERGLPDISYALPLLFVGDEYYVGYEEIEETLTTLKSSLK